MDGHAFISHGYVDIGPHILGYLYYYYGNRVLTSFWSNITNFTAMATKVGCGKF